MKIIKLSFTQPEPLDVQDPNAQNNPDIQQANLVRIQNSLASLEELGHLQSRLAAQLTNLQEGLPALIEPLKATLNEFQTTTGADISPIISQIDALTTGQMGLQINQIIQQMSMGHLNVLKQSNQIPAAQDLLNPQQLDFLQTKVDQLLGGTR